MSRKEQIQLFETKKVRTVWDDEKEEWFFSVVDVVEVLTDSANPTDYLKKIFRVFPNLEKSKSFYCINHFVIITHYCPVKVDK